MQRSAPERGTTAATPAPPTVAFAAAVAVAVVRFGVFLALLIAAAAPIQAQSRTREATIHRDEWGVPHVLSETDEGAVFGMAWALAEDDWPLIEENYLHALGRYAELVGARGLRDDWMARALEIVPLSLREYEAATPRMRRLLDAFADGMNRWLAARPPEAVRVLTRIEPWYPLALIRYKYYQNEFLGYAGLRDAWALRLYERSAAAANGGGPVGAAGQVDAPAPPDDDEPRYYDALFDAYGVRPFGSNQWAVAPARTAGGHALLLINPHQSFVGVQRYAEIHLDSREGLRFSGLTVFGFLLPYMGHNERLGWAYTDNYADHSDLYGERFDDRADPLRYRHGGGWRTATNRVDSIFVRADDGFEVHRFRFWTTHHGPLVGIAEDGRPLAVKLARMDEGGWFTQWDGMIRARSLDEWRAAVATLRVPYMNTMYADADGNIGYIYNSAVPRRLEGVDPSGILDGSDPRTEWQGFHALDELPQVWNPSTGWLLNTNSTPFTATVGLDIRRSDFPAYMVGSETDNPRAISSRRVLSAIERTDFDAFARIIWDTRLSAADDAVPRLLDERSRIVGAVGRDATAQRRAAAIAQELGLDTTTAGAVDRAIDRIERWNRTADTSSVESTWFILAAERNALATGSPPRFPWMTALADALARLHREWGAYDVPWGRINRHQRPLPGTPPELDRSRTHVAVGGASGGLGSVFSFDSRPFGHAGPRLGRSGNSFVKVVEFGPAVRAASILNYGQSGDPASRHFFDQATLYARRSFKPAYFTREEVERNAVSSKVVR